jgi:hypothetical protein
MCTLSKSRKFRNRNQGTKLQMRSKRYEESCNKNLGTNHGFLGINAPVSEGDVRDHSIDETLPVK